MENKINKVLVLDDDEKYVVLNQAIYQGDSYLLVNEVDENEEELLENTYIVKEIVQDGHVTLEEVEDPELLQLLAKYLAPEE